MISNSIHATDLIHVHTIGPEISPGVRFAGPFGVNVAANGDVLIADDLGHRVYHFDRTYNRRHTLGPAQRLSYPDAAVLLEEGYLVADTGNNRLLFLNHDGAIVRTVSDWGWLTGRLSNPRSVVPMPGDQLLVADWGNQRVRRLAWDGALIASYGATSGPSKLDGPIDAVYVPTLGIVVSDHRNDRLVVFANDQATGTTFGPAESAAPRGAASQQRTPASLRRPSGLTAGPDGTIWVADSGNARIHVFNPDGTSRATYSGEPDRPLIRPTDLAFGPQGRLFVADAGVHAVYVYALR